MSRRGGNGIGGAVRAFRVHVDEAHLHGAKGIRQLPVAAVALVAEPGGLGPPVDVLGLPDILAAAGEAERLEPHRLQGHVAGQDHQVGPRNLPAILLLDRPQQPARLVEVCVVGPAAEGRKPQLARARAAAAVVDAVGARGVPRHPDEERPIVAEVRRPPVLRVVITASMSFFSAEIERLELLGVVELRLPSDCQPGGSCAGRSGSTGSATSRGSICRCALWPRTGTSFVAHVDVDLYCVGVGAGLFRRRRVGGSERDGVPAWAWQSGQRPQYATSASSIS